MTACERFDSLLSLHLELETSPAERRFVDGHLTVCGRCRAAARDMAATLRLVNDLPRLTVSEDFTGSVMARVRGLDTAGLDEPLVETLRFPVRRFVLPLAAAAALAVALIGLNQGWVGGAGPGAPDQAQVRTPAAEAIDQLAARTGLEAQQDPALPDVRTLPEVLPGTADARAETTPIGMMRDADVLGDWVLRQPTGGGDAVLTRVGVGTDSRVMVTF